MIRRFKLTVAAVLALLLLGVPPEAQNIVNVPTGDPVMDAAIAKAQKALPVFLEALAKPGPTDENFAVKIYYPTKGRDGEHIWAVDVKREGEQVSATIDNEPQDIPDLKHGQRVTVPIARLTDWFFFRGGRMHGGQTIRALLPKLSKSEADKFRAMLAPE